MPAGTLRRLAIALTLASGVGQVHAAPCAGFSDVQDTDSYCPAVEWLRNRSITFGCTSTNYCPGSVVTRDSMALFMNRLGTALTPDVGYVESVLAIVDPDVPTTLCATNAIASTPYPRQALLSIAFSGLSAGDVGYAARPLVSTDNGATWNPITNPASDLRESVAGSAWSNTAGSGVYAIPASQAVRFAMGVARHSGTADFSQARCQLTASVLNAN